MNGATSLPAPADQAAAPRNAALVGVLVLLIGLPLLIVPTEPGATQAVAPLTRAIVLAAIAALTAAAAYYTEIRGLSGLRAGGQAALVTAGLGMPILSILTDQSRGTNLDLVARFDLLAIACLLAFAAGWLAATYRSLGREGFFASPNLAGAAIVAFILALVGFTAHWALGVSLLAVAGVLAQIVGSRARMTATPGYAQARAQSRATFFAAAEAVVPKLFLMLALLFPLLSISIAGSQAAGKWIDNYGVNIMIFVMLGWGLNVVVGLAGLLDLGYVAFYAVGAYAYALIATYGVPLPTITDTAPYVGLHLANLGGWAFWVVLPVAGALAALWGILLGFPVLRLRGDYLAIVTLAFGEIIRLVLINWEQFTGGNTGIIGIPGVTLFGIPLSNEPDGLAALLGVAYDPLHERILLYYVILALAGLTAFVTLRLRRMPVGRAWEALREDEIACRSLGIDTVNTKLTAFAIGAMFGGFAGSFYAAKTGFINPESFTFTESAQVLAIVILGGAGSLVGVVIATVMIVGGFELLRELTFLKAVFGPGFDPTQYRALIFGLCMVLTMILRPRGIVASREPTIFLKERKKIGSELVKEGHG